MDQFPLYMQDTIEGMMMSQTPNSTHKAVNSTFSRCKVLPWGSALRAATVWAVVSLEFSGALIETFGTLLSKFKVSGKFEEAAFVVIFQQDQSPHAVIHPLQ